MTCSLYRSAARSDRPSPVSVRPPRSTALRNAPPSRLRFDRELACKECDLRSARKHDEMRLPLLTGRFAKMNPEVAVDHRRPVGLFPTVVLPVVGIKPPSLTPTRDQ